MNKRKLCNIKINLPTKTELLEIEKEDYKRKKSDVNNFSYWYPKIKDCGFKTPESIVIPLSFEWYQWLNSDHYTKERINEFKEHIIKNLEKLNFNYQRDLFIKNNDFSNKFSFGDCKVTDISKIGEQFLNLSYAGLCVGAGGSTEIVVREFISNKKGEQGNKPTIYQGMPLNTEYRIFYDFDKNNVVSICNYWDPETMKKSLKNTPDGDVFKSYENILVNDFEKHKKELLELAKKHLKNVTNIKGIWSVDFMYINDEFYLIDMATAETSYYRETIKEYVEKQISEK